MRTIKQIHKAEFRPIADLITYSPLPSRSLDMIDPFLFLNHHGPQVYPPDNNGLPFGPHPHRGMETVTFILDGDISHKDSGGGESVITAGGIQWMTAGRGLIHAEVSSSRFLKEGGRMEILQLWINLPSGLKMTEPRYIGKQKDDIPVVALDSGNLTVQLVAGELEGVFGGFETLTPVFLSVIKSEKGGKYELPVPSENNIFYYVVSGKVSVNGTAIDKLNLIEFNNDGDTLSLELNENTTIILGHAKPFNEPVVARGPFVMNTLQEIQEAYDDYQKGKFGGWEN